jgi:hypothetical protein
MKQKGIINVVITILLALILVGGGYYYWQKNQNTDKVAGWQTYTNKEAGFEIQYPDQWIISVHSNGVSGVVSIGSGVVDISWGNPQIDIGSYIQKETALSKKAKDDCLKSLEGTEGTDYGCGWDDVPQKVTFGGKTAAIQNILEGGPNGVGVPYATMIVIPEYGIEISNQNSFSNGFQESARVLSSFKFIR